MKTKHLNFTFLLFTFLLAGCKNEDEQTISVNTVTTNISGYISDYNDNSDLIDSIYCRNNDIILDKCKVNSDGSFSITLPEISSIVNQKITDKFPSKNLSDTTALVNNSNTWWYFGSIGFLTRKDNKTTGFILKNNKDFFASESLLKNYSCVNLIYCNKFTKISGTNIDRIKDEHISTSSFDLTLNKGWNEFVYTMVIDSVVNKTNLGTGTTSESGKTEQVFSNKNMPLLEWRFKRLN